MIEDQRFKQWDQWLDIIYNEVEDLLISRYIFNEIGGIIIEFRKKNGTFLPFEVCYGA